MYLFGSFACFGVARESAASKSANVRSTVSCPAALCITFLFAKWWAFEAASCPRHKALNEDNTLNLHVTPPLRKHFVGCCGAFLHFSVNRYGKCFLHLSQNCCPSMSGKCCLKKPFVSFSIIGAASSKTSQNIIVSVSIFFLSSLE